MIIVDSWSTSKIYPLTRSFAATNSFSRVTIGFSYSRSVSSVTYTNLCVRLEIHLILRFTGVFPQHVWIARPFYLFLSETEIRGSARSRKKRIFRKQLNNSLLTKPETIKETISFKRQFVSCLWPKHTFERELFDGMPWSANRQPNSTPSYLGMMNKGDFCLIGCLIL